MPPGNQQPQNIPETGDFTQQPMPLEPPQWLVSPNWGGLGLGVSSPDLATILGQNAAMPTHELIATMQEAKEKKNAAKAKAIDILQEMLAPPPNTEDIWKFWLIKCHALRELSFILGGQFIHKFDTVSDAVRNNCKDACTTPSFAEYAKMCVRFELEDVKKLFVEAESA